MKSAPTAQDVAVLANVSQSAVSRSFTPGASVSEKTKSKVLLAAKKLGYRPNAIARSLSTNQSRIIALVMSYLENQFYPLVIEHLSQELQKEGYHVLLFIGQTNNFDADSILMDILQYQVDGIIMASATLSPNLAKNCAAAGVPVVLFNRISSMSPTNLPSTSSVTTDNYNGGRMVAKTLIERGYQKIGFISGLENSSTSIQRENGLRDGLAEFNFEICFRSVGNYDFTQAKEATRELFRTSNHPDAIFVANDHMAIASMDVIREELQLRIPEDIGLIGFDNIPQANWQGYQLTTISQDVNQMVLATVRVLLSQIQNKIKPEHIVIPCEIIERNTLRKPLNTSL
jgi:DNA-binding LacI/PurR family transcriptional regulator